MFAKTHNETVRVTFANIRGTAAAYHAGRIGGDKRLDPSYTRGHPDAAGEPRC